jgi:1-deoxy-D-xylulose-5-phosphate reductoisomerase
MKAARQGVTFPAVLSAADEEAVRAFLEGRIGFIKIAEVIEKVLSRHRPIKNPTIDDILDVDKWAKEEARRLC